MATENAVPYPLGTVDELKSELERLTGKRYVFDLDSSLRTWFAPKDIPRMTDEATGEAHVGFLQVAVSVARAAFSKGWQAGQRGDGAAKYEPEPEDAGKPG